MNITVDANILFSALLKDGETRRLWFNIEFTLFAPAYLLVEFSKYKIELLKKFMGSSEEFDDWTGKLVSQIKFIPDEELISFLPAAATLLTDSNDWLYLACALKEDTILWSQDKGFLEQKRIKVKNTKEMREEFGGF